MIRADTVTFDDANNALVILDQTLLPVETKMLSLTTIDEIGEAIRVLRVRGAPAIGVAAAIGVYLAVKAAPEDSFNAFFAHFRQAKGFLAATRPTAVNLFWALDRMEKVVTEHQNLAVGQIKTLLRDEAVRIQNEDAQICKQIGENGLRLLKNGDGLLTHCNAGRLAATQYGTALAPIYLGHERGYQFKVYADETRPLLQGARLTAYELHEAGIDVTLICDNMASRVMKNGWIQAVLTGCDRVAANGDACNKIGTSGLAILARHYRIPFYICAPLSTIDFSLPDGGGIPVEERDEREITELWYQKRMAPRGVKAYNPAFDVTDNSLITAIITERGVVSPPYTQGLQAILQQ